MSVLMLFLNKIISWGGGLVNIQKMVFVDS